jgi:predicted nucleic acid-binding protein
MNLKAIFVETNWVVDIIAPAHLQSPQAIQLLQRAETGEFELYLPAICLAEARETIPRRFAPRMGAKDLRKFVRWAKSQDYLNTKDSEVAFSVLQKFEELVEAELTKVPERLNNLRHHTHLKVFPLSEPMLERQVSIGAMDLSLKPYDLAILSAILVRGEALRREGFTKVCFCELDSDLQPWNKLGAPKPNLKELYDDAQIEVYDNFLLEDVNDI